MLRFSGLTLAVLSAFVLTACQKSPPPEAASAAAPAPPAGQVDDKRLLALPAEPGAWLTGGRDFGKTHYSPLQTITPENLNTLGFAWDFATGTDRGMEATPIVVDGVMYTSGVAGRVYA